MKTQIKALVILFLTVTFSSFAGQATVNEDPVVAVFNGFSEEKGFTFTVGEGEAAKELSFAKVDETLLKEVNLKDKALVGKSFELVYGTHEGVLHLEGLKKVE